MFLEMRVSFCMVFFAAHMAARYNTENNRYELLTMLYFTNVKFHLDNVFKCIQALSKCDLFRLCQHKTVSNLEMWINITLLPTPPTLEALTGSI